MEITKKQARQFILAHQHLLEPGQLEGKDSILKYIRKVGCIQFDPLNRVGRNPDLVLQSRVNDYQPHLLEELLYIDRNLVDGWDKNMAIYPIEDWPYFSRYRERARKRHKNNADRIDEILSEVRKAIREEGPISSIDLDFDKKVDWSWAPTRAARAALESMYSWGELIIHHKVGTRKVYDFAENHLPDDISSMPDPNSSMEEYFEWHVRRRIGAIGLLWALSGSAWLGIDWMKSKERKAALNRLMEKEQIVSVKVEGLRYRFYIRKEEETLLKEIIDGVNYQKRAAFIAPLDNLMWDRKLLKKIFDFEYIWEVYKPVAEREYGYYVLPIIYGDRFVGRFEPKLDKETNRLEILGWWWEEEIDVTEEMKGALRVAFDHFMNYLGAKDVKIKTDEDISWLVRN